MSYNVENNVIKTEEIEYNFEEYGGLGNLMFDCMKKYSQNIAQIDPITDRKDTYEYFLRNAIRTAIKLKSKGIKKGDVVLGCSDNDLDACVPMVAALFLGAIPCSMDPSATVMEMIHMITQVKPKIIFAMPLSIEKINEVIQELKLDIEIVVFAESDKYAEFHSFTELQHEEDEFKPVVSKDSKETAIIYFSSGTSGLQKPCCLSHAFFMYRLMPMKVPDDVLDVGRRNYELAIFNEGGSYLVYSPFYWITGGISFFQQSFKGGTRVLCKEFDAGEFWHFVEKYKVLEAFLSPYQILQLIKYGRPPNVSLDSLLRIPTGGMPLPRKHWQLIQNMLPDTDIIQVYGMTETGRLTFFDSFNKVHREYYKAHPESVGFPFNGIWYKVVDPETDQILGPNQEGELMVKYKYFMNGFYNESAESPFDSEGWLRTGDLVYYTEDYAFYITDRLKEIMGYRQLIVYPYIIEQELMKHPAVAEVAVVGIPHEEDGEHPTAFVVLNENSERVVAKELREFADERLQGKAKLRGDVRIMKSLPRTSTEKIKRRELKRMVLAEMN